MKKWSICSLAVILTLSIQNNIEAQKIALLKTTVLHHFPSASSLEFRDHKLYVIGDDARDVLILNNQHGLVDSINLFKTTETRINKEEKADLEASIIFDNHLVAFSSLSTKERNKLLMLDLETQKAKIKNYDLGNLNLPELNIEGATMCDKHLLLSNRANSTNKTNYLIVAKIDDDKIDHRSATLISIKLPKSKTVIGISGLAYVNEKDILLFTASTENTNNAYSDGEIGESYLGFVPNISKKLTEKEITIEKLVNLKKIFSTKSPQKIESTTVESIEGNKATIHLAADNDNGKSTLFKAYLTLPKSK